MLLLALRVAAGSYSALKYDLCFRVPMNISTVHCHEMHVDFECENSASRDAFIGTCHGLVCAI